MKIVRRIAAVVGMVLAVVFLVVLVGLIAGVWFARQPIVDGILGIVAPFEYAGQSATDLVAQTGAELATVQGRLDAAQARTEAFLASPERQAEAGARLRDELSAALGTDIGATTAQVQTLVTAVSRAVQVADQAVAAAAQVGLLPRARVSGARLAELDQEMSALRTQVDQIASQVENPTGQAAADVARSLQTVLADTALSLDKFDARLDEVAAAVTAYNAEVRAVKAAVPPGVTIGSLVLTFVFGWLAFGQISLFTHMLAWFRRP